MPKRQALTIPHRPGFGAATDDRCQGHVKDGGEFAGPGTPNAAQTSGLRLCNNTILRPSISTCPIKYVCKYQGHTTFRDPGFEPTLPVRQDIMIYLRQLEHVFASVDDPQGAVLCPLADVACVKPPLLIEDLFCADRVTEVALQAADVGRSQSMSSEVSEDK